MRLYEDEIRSVEGPNEGCKGSLVRCAIAESHRGDRLLLVTQSESEQDSAPVIRTSEELIHQLTLVGLLSPGQLIMGREVLAKCDAVQHTGETR